MRTSLYVFRTPGHAQRFVRSLQPRSCDCATLRLGRCVWVAPVDHMEARQAFQIARDLGGELA